VLAGLANGYKVTATPGTAQAQEVVVGVMAGISNDMSIEQQNARLKEYKDAALVIASRCSVVCTVDHAAMRYLKGAGQLGYPGVRRPKIYRGHKKHRDLCCDAHITGVCVGGA
jgi:hypothetical protein